MSYCLVCAKLLRKILSKHHFSIHQTPAVRELCEEQTLHTNIQWGVSCHMLWHVATIVGQANSGLQEMGPHLNAVGDCSVKI